MNHLRMTLLLAAILLGRGGGVLLRAEEPAATTFTETDLHQALTAVLQRDHVRDLGELELTLTRRWATLTVTNTEPVSLQILELPTLGVTANFIVRFALHAGSQSLGAWQMPVTARVWRDVWIARSPLRRGQLLSETDRVRERRDVLTIRDTWSGGTADEPLCELAESVPAGAPLLQRHVKPRTLVRRGQIIEAVARSGALVVSLKVEALEDGAAGQQVRVRNLQTKREFRGKVENEATVTVAL